jgi:hypothetical protein
LAAQPLSIAIARGTADPPKDACAAFAFLLMQKHSRQDDGNEIDHEMADHVRDQVAPPEIDEHQDCAESEGKDDVNQAIGSMPEAEDQQRDDSGPVAVQSK